jgi:hypothetical protein
MITFYMTFFKKVFWIDLLFYYLNQSSQLIRYARVCFAYEDFSKRGRLLTNKLMLQGYNESCLIIISQIIYARYNNLVRDYKLPLAHMLDDLFHTIG